MEYAVKSVEIEPCQCNIAITGSDIRNGIIPLRRSERIATGLQCAAAVGEDMDNCREEELDARVDHMEYFYI